MFALAWDASRFAMRRRGDGTTRGDFTIPDAEADHLRAALEALAAPRRKRSTANRHALGIDDIMALPHDQRLGLAFLELIEHLPEGALPQAGGLAATVAVTVDVMRSGTGTATTTSGGTMSAAQAQRLACNAHIAAHDRGCVWAGCDRPPSHCEAHHITPWSHDGPTTLDNGALLYFFHHHLLHENTGWKLWRARDGIVDVIPPPRVDPGQVPRRHARFTRLEPRAAS